MQLGGHHGLSHVTLRVQQNDVQFGRKEAHQRHCPAQTDRKTHGGQPNLYVVSSTEVDGYKRQPDDTCGVHCESNVLGLVECFGDFSSQYGVDGAYDDEEDGIGEAYHVLGADGRDAHELVVPAGWVIGSGSGRRHHDPDGSDEDLDSHQTEADDQLRRRRDELGSLHSPLPGPAKMRKFAEQNERFPLCTMDYGKFDN